MNMKSDQTKTTASMNFVKFLEVIHLNMLPISVTTISLAIIIAIAIQPPPAPKKQYDCSTLSPEKQTILTATVHSRLELIKGAMNTSLIAGYPERNDMQDTIEQIMADTRKEFCAPIGK